MNKLKIKKTNAGFTLVEIIVVIVILAVMVGLTIGGLYGRVDKDFYNATRDNDKEINYVIVQSNGVVIIHTKKKKGKNNAL